jgi:hypothetical protein
MCCVLRITGTDPDRARNLSCGLLCQGYLLFFPWTCPQKRRTWALWCVASLTLLGSHLCDFSEVICAGKCFIFSVYPLVSCVWFAMVQSTPD